MTEKTRFIYKDNSMWFSFIDRQTGKHLNAIMCCNLMNELHEENEQLKHDATVLICSNQEYRKENEQLKNKIDVLEDDNETYHKSLERLNLYTKRFIPTKCTNEFKDCKIITYERSSCM